MIDDNSNFEKNESRNVSNGMKILISYYSRTGVTKKVALKLKEQLNCEVEEIFDTKNRSGAWGYLTAGRDATLKKQTVIKQIGFNPKDFDLVIIGTPIWSFTMSTPIRTYLTDNLSALNKVAFFCTQGGNGAGRAFLQMEQIIKKSPVATLTLTTKEVIENNFNSKLEDFVKRLV
jgi:flavodoxin